MNVRCDNQYKTGADRGTTLGQSRLFECLDICVLNPEHESEMRGYLVYALIVKYLSHRCCSIQAQYIRFNGLIVEYLEDFLKTFLEGSVDRLIYWDYIVNRCSFI